MKSKALLIIVALTVSLAIGVFATGCGGGGDKADSPANTTESKDNDANPPKSEPDSDAFRDIAVDACVDSAAESGVSDDMAQEYCDCAIDKMLENMSSEQIADIALSGDSELPSDVEDELMNAVLDCIDKLME